MTRVLVTLNKKKYFIIMVPALILAIISSYLVPREQGYWVGMLFILAGWVIYYFWIYKEKDKTKN